MHCDVKNFQYTGGQQSSINSAKITASVYGTTITLNDSAGKKEDIVNCLSKAGITIQSAGLFNISIRTPLHNTANIKKSLDTLSENGLINPAFAQEIATNYPNGHGGKMDLSSPFKGVNALLMVAASNIYSLNEQLKSDNQVEEDSKVTVVGLD